MTLKIQRLSPLLGESIPLPYYATPGAAGMDIRACIQDAVTLPPGGRALIPAGFAIELPSAQYVACLYARSGLAVREGICLSNGVGVIDSDYRGELQVGLINLSDRPYTVQPGERVAQLIISPVVQASLELSDTLEESRRGAGGFGSTGKA